MKRIDDALRWLIAEISASHDEFRRAHQPGGDMLLTALITGGWATTKRGRVAVAELGHRRLADVDRDVDFAA